MASTIQLKTGTGSAVPSSLTQGEVAINIDNGLVYYGSGSTNTTKQLESFTQITASGNISASGKFIGKIDTTDTNADDNFYAIVQTGAGELPYTTNAFHVNPSTNIMTTGHLNVDAGITGGTHITASGNISASGDIISRDLTISRDINALRNISASGKFIGAEISASTAVGGLTLTGNVTASGNISSSATITANAFVGDGSGITGITVSNENLTVDNATLQLNSGTTYNGSGAKTISIKDGGVDSDALAANITVTQLTASFISSSGTSSLGMLIVDQNITASGNISASGTITANSLVGTLATAAQTNITSLGTLTGLSVAGNIAAGAHDGSDILYVERFSGAYPYAHIRAGIADNNVKVGIKLNTRKADGVVEDALVIEGDTREATFANVVNCTALNTGQGDYELYAMNQDVETTDNVVFAQLTASFISSSGTSSLGMLYVDQTITASGISSSGEITANSYVDVKTSGTGYKLSGAKIVYNESSAYVFGRGPSATRITGSTISLGGPGDPSHVTASGNISASGNITAPSYTGQVMALDRLNYYITINSSDYFLGRSVGVESGDFDIIPTSPFEINDEQVFSANILPVSMSTVGLRSGVRVSGGGTCQIWITTGSRSDWPTANTVPLGFGASGSVTLGNGQDFGTLDIPEFSINDNCDAVYIFVRSEDGDDPTMRITGQLYGRTR
jgi:hypothetical protein